MTLLSKPYNWWNRCDHRNDQTRQLAPSAGLQSSKADTGLRDYIITGIQNMPARQVVIVPALQEVNARRAKSEDRGQRWVSRKGGILSIIVV